MSLADLGKAKGCFTNNVMILSINIIKLVTLFLPWLYGATKPKRLKMVLPVIQLCCTGLRHSQTHRISQFHNWFKSFANFAEGVELYLEEK